MDKSCSIHDLDAADAHDGGAHDLFAHRHAQRVDRDERQRVEDAVLQRQDGFVGGDQEGGEAGM